MFDFACSGDRVRRALFSPSDEQNFVSVEDSAIRFFRLDSAASGASIELPLPADSEGSSGSRPSFWSGAFDPHHSHLFLSSDDCNLRVWDTRAGSAPVQSLLSAHEGIIRSVDYNPNKPHQIASGGEDTKLNIWDLRKWRTKGSAQPPNQHQYLRQLCHHTHWLWSVEFNRFHDQLLLSAGTELVNLWSVVSVSSAPLGELEINPDHPDRHDKHEDQLIRTYSDHEESVYGAVWSRSDAWTFASISYDGRIILNHVPTKEKYKILL